MIDGLYMPGLSEAWTGDLHCQAAANIGPNTWGGIKLRLCSEWSQCSRFGEVRELECDLIWISDPMSTPVTILGGELWSEVSVGWLLWERPVPSHRLTTLFCQLSLNTQLISWGGVEDLPGSLEQRHLCAIWAGKKAGCTVCFIRCFKGRFFVCLFACF